MDDTILNIIIFVAAVFALLNGARMSLEFLERMRRRQYNRRERGRIPLQKYAVPTQQGPLLDENGDIAVFEKRRDDDIPYDAKRALIMTRMIDEGAFGITPASMVDYYRDIPILEPLL